MTNKDAITYLKEHTKYYEPVNREAFRVIEEALKKLEYYENEKYKHWNIFFNGAKLEYLLYLEKKGKESFMTSISEELYSKIKEHFSDEKRLKE